MVTDRAGRPCPWVPLPMPLPLPDPWSVDFGRNRGGDRCTEPGMAYLDHENLDVYHVAIEFLPAANRIADAFPRGYSWLADQLRRAATSICLNIAEGAGEFSGKEKARFYRMAKRSATESAAILDAWRALGSPIEQGDELSSARDYIVRIVSMLVRMVQRVEQGHGVGHGQGHGHGHARARESDARTSGT